jgi:hypothetical protein
MAARPAAASSAAEKSFSVAKAASKTSLSLSATRVTYAREQAEKLSVAVSAQYTGTPSGRVSVKTGSINRLRDHAEVRQGHLLAFQDEAEDRKPPPRRGPCGEQRLQRLSVRHQDGQRR